MATPARAPIQPEGKTEWWKVPLLAGLITLVMYLLTLGITSIKAAGADAVTLDNINTRLNQKVDKNQYDTDREWLKQNLEEIKTDVKDLKRMRESK